MKPQFQDIIPKEKRSIRNIAIDSIEHPTNDVVQSKSTPRTRTKKEIPEPDYNLNLNAFEQKPKSFVSNIGLWILSIICLCVFMFVLTRVLEKADLSLVLKKYNVELPSSLTLYVSPADGQVGYSTITLADSSSESVIATGEKDVSTNATGQIIIYNNYSTQSQKFVSGTRFETGTGLVYKLDKTTTVGGMKKSGTKTIPGSVVASVTAEKPGSDYNIALVDFKVPGFKGTPKYDGFYARSKTEMTGGSLGKVAVVGDQDKNRAVSELEAKLTVSLRDKLEKSLPQNQTILDDVLVYDFKVGDPKLDKTKAVITVDGTLKAYIADTKSLALNLLATKNISDVVKGANFVVDMKDASTTLGATTDTSITLAFTGTAHISYVFDPEQFKESLAGVNESDIPMLVNKYPAISSIKTQIKPFWIHTIPSNTAKISLTSSD